MVISPGGTCFRCHFCTSLCDLEQFLCGYDRGVTFSLVPLDSTKNLGQAEVRPGPGQMLDKQWLLSVIYFL